MATRKDMREQASRKRQDAKRDLIQIMRELLLEHGFAADYLSRIAAALNDRAVATLTGRKWTTRNLWQFFTTNEDRFRDLSLPGRVGSADEAEQTPDEGTMDLQRLVDWAMQYKRFGLVPVVIRDRNMLENVESVLEAEDRSLNDLVHELLTKWLATNEHRMAVGGGSARITHSPVCLWQADGVISISEFRRAVVKFRR